MIRDRAVVDCDVRQVELARKIDQHRAAAVVERVAVEDELAGGGDLDGAVIGEVTAGQVLDRAGGAAERVREPVIAHGAVIAGSSYPVPLAFERVSLSKTSLLAAATSMVPPLVK